MCIFKQEGERTNEKDPDDERSWNMNINTGELENKFKQTSKQANWTVLRYSLGYNLNKLIVVWLTKDKLREEDWWGVSVVQTWVGESRTSFEDIHTWSLGQKEISPNKLKSSFCWVKFVVLYILFLWSIDDLLVVHTIHTHTSWLYKLHILGQLNKLFVHKQCSKSKTYTYIHIYYLQYINKAKHDILYQWMGEWSQIQKTDHKRLRNKIWNAI